MLMRFIDLDGMLPFAEYYDGTFLGDDGVDDDMVYVLDYGKAANFKNKLWNCSNKVGHLVKLQYFVCLIFFQTPPGTSTQVQNAVFCGYTKSQYTRIRYALPVLCL